MVNGSLPSDIESVWGVSDRDRETAVFLIGEWGLDVFRSSAIHVAAVHEQERLARKRASDAKVRK